MEGDERRRQETGHLPSQMPKEVCTASLACNTRQKSCSIHLFHHLQHLIFLVHCRFSPVRGHVSWRALSALASLELRLEASEKLFLAVKATFPNRKKCVPQCLCYVRYIVLVTDSPSIAFRPDGFSCLWFSPVMHDTLNQACMTVACHCINET